jgi:hypothetical protein
VRHERVAQLLSEYLEGSLRPRDRARVEAHLLGCPACRQALGELRRTTELLRGLRGGVEAPDLADAVLARIRAGEAEPSVLDRVRAGVSRFLAGPLGAPLATACVGLTLLAVLPRIEVEVSIPGRLHTEAASGVPASPPPRAAEPSPPAEAPLLARRVNESLAREPGRLAPPASYSCFEAASFEACRDHHAYMTRLAMENVRAFMARVQEVPEPRRDVWLGELSRFAADSGDAEGVAARLRASGDPLAQRVALRFEQAR